MRNMVGECALFAAVGITIGVLLMGAPALAGPGDSLHVGPATFVDNNTGTTYNLHLEALESCEGLEAGAGCVNAGVHGPRLSFCTAHGPGAVPDSFPLTEIQCGRAFAMSVAIAPRGY